MSAVAHYTDRSSGAAGLGSWSAIIAAGLTATAQTTSLVLQQRMQRDAAKRAEHEAAREHQRQLDMMAAQQKQAEALAKAQAEAAMAAGATGGAVAIGPDGRPLPASGVMSRIPGGGMGALAIGAGVLVIGFFLLKGRR